MRTLTDEQIIDRLRRAQRYRRPLGIAFLCVGVVCAVLLFYFVNNMRTRSLAIFAELQPGSTPTTQQIKQTFDAAQFNIGFGLGSAFITGLTSCCSLAASGFVFLFPNRKDRLLLECWGDRRTAH